MDDGIQCITEKRKNLTAWITVPVNEADETGQAGWMEQMVG